MLDGAPLNVFADGLGAIQVRQDGLAAGLFYDPDENPGHAGLEIKEGASYYPLIDGFSTAPGRVSNEPITTTALPDGSQLMHTSYRVGPHLLVSEDIVYLNGTSSLTIHYGIQNVTRRRRLAARGRGRRPLRRQQRQRQRRHLAAPAALRRRPRRGQRARLRPAGDHPLAHLPGGRLRARLQQLLRRRAQQHGGLGRARQRRRRGLRARPRAGRDPRHRRPVAAGRAGAARHRPGNADHRRRGATTRTSSSPATRSSTRCRRRSPARPSTSASARAGSSSRSRRARSSSSSRTRCQIPVGATVDSHQGPREPGHGRRPRTAPPSSRGSTTASSSSARQGAPSR